MRYEFNPLNKAMTGARQEARQRRLSRFAVSPLTCFGRTPEETADKPTGSH
jgi:hypothetical protein